LKARRNGLGDCKRKARGHAIKNLQDQGGSRAKRNRRGHGAEKNEGLRKALPKNYIPEKSRGDPRRGSPEEHALGETK